MERYTFLRRISLLLIALSTFSILPAQKILKPVKTLIKAKNGSEALKQVQNLEKDSVAARLPQLYDYGKQAQILINDTENEKAFLKQAYDTAGFFNSTLGIYEYILKCEQEEQRCLAEGEARMKFHRENSEILHRYIANINAGGRYFYSKQKYAEAMNFFRLFLDVPQLSIWGADKHITATPVYANNAYLYQKCAYLNKDYEAVERYKAINLSDTTSRRSTSLEYLAMAATARKDTAALVGYLQEGVDDYPANMFFFTRLADHYAANENFNALLDLSDTMLKRDSLNFIVLEARSLALMRLSRYEEAISTAVACIDADSSQVDPYYYVGAAYCYMALDVKMPTSVGSKTYVEAMNRRRDCYQKARLYLEKYRSLAPEEKSKWAPLLYRVYFSLNLGKQFDEISKMAEAKS